ncbi:MAG: HAD family hydrolase [Candidatus Binatia bacterium]|nr:HAD family hydrolase [Candidatus Binatia bacterium]
MTQAVLFDLFGTLVHFSAEVTSLEAGQERWRRAMRWLAEAVAEQLPGCPFESFLEALSATTREIVGSRAPDYWEVPSVERFRRALRRLGVEGPRQQVIAHELAETHMAHLVSGTAVDPCASAVLSELRRRGYRLGLVSNFDHAPAAYRTLERHGLRSAFDAVVISAAFGRRKPHPSIFLSALQSLGAKAEDSWFVGDTYEEDIVGALAAGIRALWLHPEPDPSTRAREGSDASSPTVRTVSGLQAVPACIEAEQTLATTPR